MCEPQEEAGPHKCWLLDILFAASLRRTSEQRTPGNTFTQRKRPPPFFARGTRPHNVSVHAAACGALRADGPPRPSRQAPTREAADCAFSAAAVADGGAVATTTARSKAGHGLAHGLAADDRGEDALMVSLAQGVACKGSLPPLPDSEACAAKSLGGRSTRTTATKSALQFATAVADGCAFHGDRAQVVLQLGRLELLGLALLRNLRDVVHDIAAAAACDGPTPPPLPPQKGARGSRHGASVRSPLTSGFRDAATP